MVNLSFLTKLQITIFNKSFIIYIVSFYRYKLMSHWLDFYYKHAVKPLENVCYENNLQNVSQIDMQKKYSFTIGKANICKNN